MSICSGRVFERSCVAIPLGWLTAVASFASAEVAPPRWLTADASAQRYESFAAEDDEVVVNAVPNAAAAEWLARRAPRFDCPDAEFVETYDFRWWAFRKHVRETPSGLVLTEFLTPVSHAGPHNTIACAVGHHVAEGRWLRDTQLLYDYLRFWLVGGPDGGAQSHFHRFSGWLAAAVDARRLATGDSRLAIELLDALVADYRLWEEERLTKDRLFWQHDVRDGMEESISGSRTERHIRPPLNCYMVDNARAIAAIAEEAGRPELAAEFRAKSAALREKVTASLWNPEDEFFEVRREDGSFAGVREAIGYLPWLHGIAGPEHAAAWRQLTDPEGFAAPRGLTTAERRHPDFRTHGVGTCEWDGAVWPFATSQTLGALANHLREPGAKHVSRRDYFDALVQYARSHRKEGKPYLGEYHDELTGDWLIAGPKERRSRYYNHSTFTDLVVTGLVGVVPQRGDHLVIDPLLPTDTWDWFCLDGLPYHGRELTVVWDRDGERYGRGVGLSVWEGSRLLASNPMLSRIEVLLTSGGTSR